MPASPARAAAFQILMRVERDDAYASELLHSDALSKLSNRDHGLTTELLMGVLRWRSLLDEYVSAASSQKLTRLDPEVLTSLRMGAYQLRFLSKVPARAAIFESVELVKGAKKKSAASFVNAVLRKIEKESGNKISKKDDEDHRSAIGRSATTASLARNAAHPEWLVARWVNRYGLEAVRKLCLQNQSVPATSISIRGQSTFSEEQLAAEGVTLSPGEIVSSARRVLAGDITQTQSFRHGGIYIQDEGSQLVALLAAIPATTPATILDCCAAPGSKTSLIANRNPQSRVFATELHPHRARLLRRLTRESNVSIIVADACSMPFSERFERILADVPCSGTGTLGHNPEIKWRLKKEDLADLQAKQIAILKSAMNQLTMGGRILYSTCSLEQEENEDIVQAARADSTNFTVLEIEPELDRLRASGDLVNNVVGNGPSLVEGPYLRTVPGVHPCDGFFAALIERA